ncbi:hypothetical protein J437_LFUL017797 [Ladona fulva]|uniref:Uncharacterized protein n=1 Tax=Ladona fulva TaxID=123851 RepID=A0A8K0PAM1_LADFU|nr:hypothetical protein J437_LFUL017797 [Ladona fulva]
MNKIYVISKGKKSDRVNKPRTEKTRFDSFNGRARAEQRETRWKGNKAKELADGYKLIYSGTDERRRNGIIDKELKGGVYEVERKSDRIMCVKLEIGRGSTTIVCGYAPQAGCEEEEKNIFWR